MRVTQSPDDTYIGACAESDHRYFLEEKKKRREGEGGPVGLPKTREEIEAEILRLNEEREDLQRSLAFNGRQIAAVQALCDHPETYFRDFMGRAPTDICKVCGKHDVPPKNEGS